MIKLLDLLTEKIVKIPEDQLTKARSVFSYIEGNKKSLSKLAPDSYKEDPYVSKKFKNFFKLNTLQGDPISVSLGFYNDESDNARARWDSVGSIVMINLAKLTDEHSFESAIEHELVHAIDPKVYIKKLDKKLGAKAPKPLGKNAKSSTIEKHELQMIKHLSSPAEFDAHTATLVNTLSKNFSREGVNAKALQDTKKQLMSALSKIKTSSYKEVFSEFEDTNLPLMFLRGKWSADRIEDAKDYFYEELAKIKAWSTNEDLYKRFLKRLGSEL